MTTTGTADGSIIAPIMTAHIIQTAATSDNVHADCIGIIKVTTGAAMCIADQTTSPQAESNNPANVSRMPCFMYERVPMPATDPALRSGPICKVGCKAAALLVGPVEHAILQAKG